MNYSIHRLLFVSIALSFVFACAAVVPTQQAWHPWTRILGHSDKVEPNATINIQVLGKVEPLLGDVKLEKEEIKSIISDLLMRRGFVISDNALYDVKVAYRSSGTDKGSTIVSHRSSMLTGSSSSAGNKSNLGVSIAKAVALAFNTQSTTVSSSTAISYTHNISVELWNVSGLLVWQGESTWESSEVDITDELLTPLQLLLSDLPNESPVHPKVPIIKISHTLNYIEQYCNGRRFSCPALPNQIMFDADRFHWIDKTIENPEALASYLDLIKTAENALPTGGGGWDDPVQELLWSKVQLGGSYLVGEKMQPVNILINLYGKSDGYRIKKCWIANEEEWQKFQSDIESWRAALINYYDMYE